MSDDDLSVRITKRTAINLLGHMINQFDAAVDEGSIDNQLVAGKQLRDVALEVAQLHS
jgi:hypothetical protein